MVNFVHNIKNIQTLVATTIRKTPLGLLRKKNPKYKVMKNGKQNLRLKKGKTNKANGI
jgi:hypothetical protein